MSDFNDNNPDDMTQVFDSDGVPESSEPSLTQQIEQEILNDLDNFNEDEDISSGELITEEKKENLEEKLMREVEILQEKLAFEIDQKMRIAAEFENFKKRTQKTSELTIFRAQSDLLESFIPVLDHLEMAYDHAQKSSNIESLMNGLDMVLKQFTNALDKWNIVPVEALGKKFDPNLHEAMAQDESHLYSAGTVISQWQRGYILGDRLIRPARVVVSKGPGPSENTESEDSASPEKENSTNDSDLEE